MPSSTPGPMAPFRPSANFGARPTATSLPHTRPSEPWPSVSIPTRCRVATHGAGRAQFTFAVESMLDLVGPRDGIDPFAFRRQNLLQDGEASPFGDHWLDVRQPRRWNWLRRLTAGVPQERAPTVRFGRGLAVYDRATHAPQRTSMRLRLQLMVASRPR